MFLMKISILLLIIYPNGSQSARLSGTLNSGDRKYACNDHDITLDWRYTLGPGESLEDIKWFFRGQSEELIATYLHRQFFSSPPFARRAQFVDNAGLTLSPVTVGDSGNYSVVVTVLGSLGSFIRLESHIFVDVREGLLTNDGRLHLSLSPVAVRDPLSNEMSLELWCGNFSYNDIPPFSVQFQNPLGETLQTKPFRENHYTALLSLPIADGTYTCRIPSSDYDEACLQGDNAHQLAQDSLAIVGSQATIKLLQAENADLKNEINMLLCLIHGGPTCAAPSGGDGRRRRSTSLNNLAAPSRGGTPVAFSADLRSISPTGSGDRVMRNGDVFVFENVDLNEGGAYNSLTGVFVAPVAGTYYFTVLISLLALPKGAATGTNDNSVGFCIHADGASPDGLLKCVYSSLDVAMGSIQVHLQPHSQVWVEIKVTTRSIYNAKMAHFSGVLLNFQP